jgi:hypothetical protein
MSDLDERLAEMRDRSEKAMPGPWEAGLVVHPTAHRVGISVVQSQTGWPAQCVLSRDAEFIAHARTDLDDLLGAVEDVLALHTSDGHAPDDCGEPDCWEGCVECTEPWPCSTVAAITARLGGA